MKRKGKKFQKKNTNSLSKLSLFQKTDGRFNRSCPLSVKNAPIIDYKNVSLLKIYISENNKIISLKSPLYRVANKKNLLKKLKS